MTLSYKKIWIFNILTSGIILTFLLAFPLKIIGSISNFLLAINRPAEYLHFSIYDAIIISLIPISSFFLYYTKTNISFKTIVLANLTTLLSIVTACVLAFILIAYYVKADTTLIPDYVVIVPFPKFFWKPIFIIGILAPHIFKKTRKKSGTIISNAPTVVEH